MDDFGRYTKGGLKVDLSNITQTGINQIQKYANDAAGNVSSVNNQLPNNTGNVSLNADNIPAGVVNKYLTQTSLSDELKLILTNDSDLLTRKNNQIVKISGGTAKQILAMNDLGTDIHWIDSSSQDIALNDLSDCVISQNPETTAVLKYNGANWIDERVFLSDCVDVTVVTPTNNDALVYQDDGFINRALTINDITNLENQLNLKVSKTEYTNTGDLTFANAPNSVANLAISTPGKILKVSAQSLPEWGDATTTLESLTNVETNNETYSDVLFYDNLGFNPPKWTNKQLNTSLVPELNVADPPNKYFTTQRVYDYLNVLMNDFDILYNNNGNIEGLAKGATNTYLKSFANGVGYDTVKLNELLDHSSQVRTNFTIPANGSVNMLQWIMQDSGIFDEMIIPGQNINPFFWGVRNDQDYGQWKVQNTSGNDIQIDRVNIDMAANFIIFNFVNSLIHNIMDDNLNDGTVRIRPNGINADQVGGDCQIINSNVNDLGRFRTLTAGTSINITQDDNTITISATGISLDNLTDVAITNPVAGNVLYKSGTNWVNQTLGIADISNLSTSLANKVTNLFVDAGDLLIGNGANSYVKLPLGNASQVLTVKADASNVEWKDATAGATTLAALTDCAINNVQNNQFLRYEGNNKWNNSTITTDDITASLTNPYCTPTAIQTRLIEILTGNEDILIRRGNIATRLPFTLNDNTLYLGSDGNQMVWKNVPTGVDNLFQLQDVLVDQPPVGKAVFFKYDAGFEKWINVEPVINDIQSFNILNPANKDVIIFDSTPNQFVNRGLEIDDINLLQTNLTTLQTNIDDLKLIDLADTNVTDLNLAGWLYWNSTTNKWEKHVISIGNVVNLQQELDSKINASVMTTNGDIIIRANGVPSRLAIGANNTYLKSDGATASWQTVSTYSDADVSTYLKTILTTQDDLLIRGVNNLERLPKGNDGQYLKVVNGNLEYGSATLNLEDISNVNINTIANNQALVYNSTSTNWENKSLAISDTANLQITLDSKLPKAAYSTKAGVLIASGNGTYEEEVSAVDGQILISEPTNVLNASGVKWSNLSTEVNNHLLSIATTSQDLLYNDGGVLSRLAKGGNNQFLSTNGAGNLQWQATGTTFPLLAPNGSAAAPSYSFANSTNTGLFYGGNILKFAVGGAELMWLHGTYLQLSGPRIASPTGGGNSPGLTFNHGGGNIGTCGLWSDVNATTCGISQGSTSRFECTSTSCKVTNRLDVKSTQIDDYRMSINNIFNSYSFQNSNNTNEYLKIDTGNNRVKIPNRFVSEVLKLDNAALTTTSITLNNNWFNLFMSDATMFTVNNNALSTPMSLSLIANTDEVNINNAIGIKLKIEINFSMLIDKNVSALEVTLWDMSNNVEVNTGSFHKRYRVDANYYLNYSVFGFFTPTVATQRMSIKIRVNQGATVGGVLYDYRFHVQDTMI